MRPANDCWLVQSFLTSSVPSFDGARYETTFAAVRHQFSTSYMWPQY